MNISFTVHCEKKATCSFKVGVPCWCPATTPCLPSDTICLVPCHHSQEHHSQFHFRVIQSIWVRSKDSQLSDMSNISDLGVTVTWHFPEASGSLHLAQLLSCPLGLGSQSSGESCSVSGGGRVCLVRILGVPPCHFHSGVPLGCAFPVSLWLGLM